MYLKKRLILKSRLTAFAGFAKSGVFFQDFFRKGENQNE